MKADESNRLRDLMNELSDAKGMIDELTLLLEHVFSIVWQAVNELDDILLNTDKVEDE